ncbi:MAG: energy-coupling factor ABC transporter permease [bacterium]
MSWLLFLYILLGLFFIPEPARAMHISEGILPFNQAVIWTVLGGGCVLFALWKMKRSTDGNSAFKPFLGMVGAGVFLISAMPIPVPFAGTVSHPAGTGIAAILVGPAATVVLTSITLLLHALFLAHGGLSTLGADIFAMGVLGGYAGYITYRSGRKMGIGQGVSAFLAGLAGDWATYVGTSSILALALHGPEHGIGELFTTVLVAFVPTQVPLGILEGIVAVFVVKLLLDRRPEMVRTLTRIVPVLLVGVMLLFSSPGTAQAEDTGQAWPGVDVAVVEKTAEEHGQKAAEPLIPLEGDLLLFAFLSAGCIGGFVVGYQYHKLFVVETDDVTDNNERKHDEDQPTGED